MGCEWVSYTGTNAGFWSYEWGKHGTCALSLFPTQEDYFDASIDLNNKYEATQALEASNIDPATASTQPISTLQNAFKSAWGVSPVITCNGGKLFELWLCLDTDLNAITCPSNMNYSKCSGGAATFPQGNEARKKNSCHYFFIDFMLSFYSYMYPITKRLYTLLLICLLFITGACCLRPILSFCKRR